MGARWRMNGQHDFSTVPPKLKEAFELRRTDMLHDAGMYFAMPISHRLWDVVE